MPESVSRRHYYCKVFTCTFALHSCLMPRLSGYIILLSPGGSSCHTSLYTYIYQSVRKTRSQEYIFSVSHQNWNLSWIWGEKEEENTVNHLLPIFYSFKLHFIGLWIFCEFFFLLPIEAEKMVCYINMEIFFINIYYNIIMMIIWNGNEKNI